jgi:hypothetical protein
VKHFKTEVFINGKSIASFEHRRSMEYCTRTAVFKAHYALAKAAALSYDMKEGDFTSFSANISIVQTCLVNHRAAARPHDVVQKEREDRLAAALKERQEYEERKRKGREDVLAAQALLRQRVRNQIDLAFKTGVSGSEPAAKYITCDYYNCNAQAAVLVLSRPIQKGATALDEDTIIGVRCELHKPSNTGVYRVAFNAADAVECSRLEFWYDGVRKITIMGGQQ